ncbi:AP endonuclease, family 2 [Clostridiales bacterium 1_7_47FAA]|nr:AP endonuclease, family 2 [Clostridiales bacterium 1_7_47FAA]
MELIAGHTMGTPEYTVEEAMELFAGIGLDGIEIVVQDDYRCGIPNHVDEVYLQKIKDAAKHSNIRIICLTPYYCRFNDLDDAVRESDIEGVKKVIDYAVFLGAEYVRIYGGSFAQEEQDGDGGKERRLVEAMRILGDVAAAKNITLVLEDHFNTMTVTARRAAEIVGRINHPNVGILYDQVNLAFVGGEEYEEAIELQKDYIRYVHVKDLIFKGDTREFKASSVSHVNEDERIVSSRVVGEGIMDWKAIVEKLRKSGYEGWYSLEYERRWHPQDLPIADVGMKNSAEHLRKCLK